MTQFSFERILLFSMIMRTFSLLAFTFQVLLGNLCMMDMASAQDMDMGSMHGTHCENCSPEEDTKEDIPMSTGCDSGHCLMHSKTNEPSVIESTNPSSLATIPASPVEIVHSVSISVHQPTSNAPPDTPFNTNKVVLRF